MKGGVGLARDRGRATEEMIRRHEAALRRTARRFSICAEDAEDAYQRALEIALTKAPTVDPTELIRWTQTVTKHEALAIRRARERLLPKPTASEAEGDASNRLGSLPAQVAGPEERAERRESIARSREALRRLKPAELRALTLLAEGYSYSEISDITGFSHTKVNRCLAEGRERFRGFVARGEDGSLCREMRPQLSAFCDGELPAGELPAVREHLRACGACRATLRAYRAAPGAAAALLPLADPVRTLGDRAAEGLAWIHSRLPWVSADAAGTAVATGGARGAGVATLAKLLAVCGTASGTAACVAAGVVPAPVPVAPTHEKPARIERVAAPLASEAAAPAPVEAPAPAPGPTDPEPPAEAEPEPEPPAPAEPAVPVSSAGAVEFEAPPPSPPPSRSADSAAAGSPAGEFGP